jgi:hypothetical protein
MSTYSRTFRAVAKGLVLVIIAALGTHAGFARDKYETIDATAWATGNQMGANIGVTLNIYQYSTPADRAILVEAFNKGQNQGLANALGKMKAVGHIEVTGTLGNDCSYIKMTVTPTGRRIVFVTNRQIRIGEAYADNYTETFNLTAGVLEINDQDKSKSTGTLYPAAKLVLDKQGELQWDLTQNPWRLSDILDWPGSAGNN